MLRKGFRVYMVRGLHVTIRVMEVVGTLVRERVEGKLTTINVNILVKMLFVSLISFEVSMMFC